MSGFIYIWHDRKHKRFYVGSHWGSEDDGYVCSSTWMKQAYKKRPHDFKRRILERFDDRSKANEIEHRWLQMIKPEELKKRYYNFHNYRFGHWSSDERSRMTIRQKLSLAHAHRVYGPRSRDASKRAVETRKLRGNHKHSDETKAKLAIINTGKKHSEETKVKMRKKTMSPEARAKISAANKGKKLSEETRAKISAARQTCSNESFSGMFRGPG